MAEHRTATGERRSKYRRNKDREVYKMAQAALDIAQSARDMAKTAADSIDAHTMQCSRNYTSMMYVGKLILGVIGTGTLLLLAGIGSIAYALFQFILANPHLFSK